MLLSTVYRCVEVISDAVAQLPCKVYNVDANGYKMENKSHPAYWILNKEPNKKMSRFTFVKLLVSSMLLKGAGYAKIDRDARGNVTQLVFIPFESVTVLEDRNNIRYQVVGYKDIKFFDAVQTAIGNSLLTSKHGHCFIHSFREITPSPFLSGLASRWPITSTIGYSSINL